MYWIFALVFTALDLLTKNIVVNSMSLGQSIPVIDGLLDLTYIHNDGAAWGIFSGKQSMLIICTAAVMLAVTAYVIVNRKKINILEKISLGMIVGGGVGNLIGRVSAGYVVDFLDIHIIPIFNVADIGVTIGCILLIITIFKSK